MKRRFEIAAFLDGQQIDQRHVKSPTIEKVDKWIDMKELYAEGVTTHIREVPMMPGKPKGEKSQEGE